MFSLIFDQFDKISMSLFLSIILKHDEFIRKNFNLV